MKTLNQFILEKFKISSKGINKEIDLEKFVQIFKAEFLSNISHLEESDFHDYNTGMYGLLEFNRDYKHYQNFMKAIEPYKDQLQFLDEGWRMNIGIKGNDATCLMFSGDSNITKSNMPHSNTIKYIDISTNIKKLLQ